MPLKNIIEITENIIKEFLEQKNIENYEIIIGKQEISEENKIYIGIIPENIQYKRLTTMNIIPNYAVNILLALKTDYFNFINNLSDILEEFIIYLFEKLAIGNISLADLEYDDINNVTIATIRFEINI